MKGNARKHIAVDTTDDGAFVVRVFEQDPVTHKHVLVSMTCERSLASLNRLLRDVFAPAPQEPVPF